MTEAQKRALNELWPKYGIADSAGPVDLRALFGNDHPVVLEIGFGNGDATWRMALASPGENFLGVEVHRPGIGHLLLKLEEHRLLNVRVACADAVEFVRGRLKDESLLAVRMYFPDPWPKRRHHKRRIVQPAFVDLLACKLRPRGILHLATDWEPYAEHMLDVIAANSAFRNLSQRGDYCSRPDWRTDTRYERRGQRLGHPVYDLLYERV